MYHSYKLGFPISNYCSYVKPFLIITPRIKITASIVISFLIFHFYLWLQFNPIISPHKITFSIYLLDK